MTNVNPFWLDTKNPDSHSCMGDLRPFAEKASGQHAIVSGLRRIGSLVRHSARWTTGRASHWALLAGALALAPTTPATAAAPAAPSAFAACAACHATEPGKVRVGPSLAGIAGRPAGSVGGFTYSAAMRGSGLIWDAANLDRFIASPSATVAGTKMAFAGIKDAQKRSEVVTYLLTLPN